MVKPPRNVPVLRREDAPTATADGVADHRPCGDLPIGPEDRACDLLAVMHRFPALG